jgi:hypothetical protein
MDTEAIKLRDYLCECLEEWRTKRGKLLARDLLAALEDVRYKTTEQILAKQGYRPVLRDREPPHS